MSIIWGSDWFVWRVHSMHVLWRRLRNMCGKFRQHGCCLIFVTYAPSGPILTCLDRLSTLWYCRTTSFWVCSNQFYPRKLQADRLWRESGNMQQSYATLLVGCVDVRTWGPSASSWTSRSAPFDGSFYTSGCTLKWRFWENWAPFG